MSSAAQDRPSYGGIAMGKMMVEFIWNFALGWEHWQVYSLPFVGCNCFDFWGVDSVNPELYLPVVPSTWKPSIYPSLYLTYEGDLN